MRLKNIIDFDSVADRIRKGETYAQVSEDLDVNEKSLADYMVRNGFRARPKNPHVHDENAILDLRKRSGMSQKELAAAMGLSSEAVRKHEQNIKQPSPKNAAKYAELLKTETIYLKELIESGKSFI